MIELLIHGTKGGYRKLYKTLGFPSSFARDMRREDVDNDRSTIDKSAYSLAFDAGGRIYSKYTGVWDAERKAIGSVIFSVYILDNYSITGREIKTLLDELSGLYWHEYVKDGNISNIQEDWLHFDAILNNYKQCVNARGINYSESYMPGNGNPAYIYYDDNSHLQKYFESPFQEEYKAYKQVFFVEKQFRDKPNNPLNALKHNRTEDLSGKIDLDNPKYILLFKENVKGGLKIKVRVNGSLCSNKSKLRKKDELEITWSKVFHISRTEKGKWDEMNNCLFINDNEKSISIKEIDLLPVVHAFVFETIDANNNPIKDAKIVLVNNENHIERNVVDNRIEIIEEELQSKWTVYARKDNLISPRREIRIDDSSNSVKLVLQENKIVKFQIADKEGALLNYTLQIPGKTIPSNITEIQFFGEEISKTWQISVSYAGYETQVLNYCPASDENPKFIMLVRKNKLGLDSLQRKLRYSLEIDQRKGKRSSNGYPFPDYVIEKPAEVCDSRFGFKFDSWKIVKEPSNDYDGYYQAIFKELWYHKIPLWLWILSLIIIAFAGFGTFAIIYNPDIRVNIDDANKHSISDSIISHSNSIVLNLDILNNLKKEYCTAKLSNENHETQISLFKKIWPFGSKSNINKNQQAAMLPDYCEDLDRAIALRTAIIIRDIAELRSMGFSNQQKNFEEAINGLESIHEEKIMNKLRNEQLRQMNLDEIASFIIKEQETIKQASINEQLKEEREEQQQVEREQQAQASQLEEEFWQLVNSGNAQMNEYKNLLEKYQSQGGEIIEYLRKICANSSSFDDKFKSIRILDRKNARRLDDIKID